MTFFTENWFFIAVLLGCFAMHLFGHGHGHGKGHEHGGGHGADDGATGHRHPGPEATSGGEGDGSTSIFGADRVPRGTHWRG